LAKRVPPAVIVPVAGIRKALGVAPDLSADRSSSAPEEPTTSKGRVDAILSGEFSVLLRIFLKAIYPDREE